MAFNNTNTAAIEQLLNNRAIPLIYVIMMTVIIIHFTEESDNGVYVLVRTSEERKNISACYKMLYYYSI